jgi:hypothetical protein
MSSASGAKSLYALISEPIEAEMQGAIPPAVKNAIFMNTLKFEQEN